MNYDLPQAMLAVISPADFLDATLLDRRRFDHARIDDVLASRVAAEDSEIATARSLTDRLLGPLNRIASRRFLREAREKVWLNVDQLHSARLQGPEAYRRRLSELEVLSAAKVADLLAPRAGPPQTCRRRLRGGASTRLAAGSLRARMQPGSGGVAARPSPFCVRMY